MTMRVALISDLHGNEVALRAVLARIDRLGVDRIVCLGDVATLGPRPEAVLDLLGEIGCTVIMGNHDEFLVDAELITKYTEAPFIVDAVRWCRERLSAPQLDFVRSFQRTVDVPLEGEATLLLFHGSPQSHMQDLLATTPADELDRLLGERRGTVMAGGHTHVQMVRQHRGTLLVNPGSVGLPFKEYVGGGPPTVLAHAEFAIVSSGKGALDVALHRVELDRAELRNAARASECPMREMLAAVYS